MKERPILMSAPMVRAILEGRKTQTRRIVKARKPIDHLVLASPAAATLCPYGQPGDRLWVKETWGAERQFDHLAPTKIPASAQHTDRCFYAADDGDQRLQRGWHKTRVSIHMPRWASRLTLEVTGVRVERLREISDEDAKAEGIPPGRFVSIGPGLRAERFAAPGVLHTNPFGDRSTLVYRHENARDAFESLWSEINGAESWDANPWVWVVSFRRLPSEAAEAGVGT